jgi:hypothetical protein
VKTFSGLALYLLLYSTIGALFAIILAQRQSRLRIMLLSLVFALGWYYLSFNFIWRSLAPLMWLLYSAQPMILGHLVYGTFLGQYPAHLPKPAAVAASVAAPTLEAAEAHESNPAAPMG